MAPAPAVFRFAVVTWAPKGSQVTIAGSHPKLGSWSPEGGPKLECTVGDMRWDSEPDYWWANVEIPTSECTGVEYKFVFKAPGAGEWTWDQGKNLKIIETPQPGERVLLHVDRFQDGTASEHDHTGRFYNSVRECNEMHCRRVTPQICLGSCPRKKNHIFTMMKEMGITAVMNFQTEADCMKNRIDGIGMEEDALAIRELYCQAGIEYVWMPTFDMSTAGRTAMLPHGSLTLMHLLKRKHVVYVHCNAGVGRSTGAVCGYLMYCLGMSHREMMHTVARQRTVAFFDFAALDAAKPHYEAMFGPPDEDLKEEKDALLKSIGITY